MWTESDMMMITPDGNVRRYIDSGITDVFGEGDAASLSFPNGYGHGCRVLKGISPAIICSGYGKICVKESDVEGNFRIRKLTPKECFRLMGVSDEDADKMTGVNSNSQCYKQAGNSIVVNVMTEMFRNLFEA